VRARLAGLPSYVRGLAMRRELWPFAIVTLLYVAIRLRAFAGVDPLRAPDTQTYEDCAARAIWNPALYACLRGWTLPVYYKLVTDDGLRIVGQFLISIAAWTYLAAAVARAIAHPRVRVVAFGATLLFSCAFTITTWDGILLSESLALSLAAVVVGAWISFIRGNSVVSLVTLIAASVLWSFDRDADAFLILLTVPFVAVWLTRPGKRRLRWIAMGSMAAIFVATSISADSPKPSFKRWPVPMDDVIRVRVLPDREALQHFKDAGMPVPQRLTHVTNTWDRGVDWFQNPSLEEWEPWAALVGRRKLVGPGSYYTVGWPERSRSQPFQDWLLEDGRRTYATFLAGHPLEALGAAWRNREALTSPPPYGRGREALPAPVQDLIYPQTFTALAITFAVVVGVAAMAARRARMSILWWVPTALLVTTIPHALFVWHSEPVEVGRHALLVGVLPRLGLVMLLLFAVDALFVRARTGPQAAP
jgi:hypothetical protein